jgi:hypothetical protein
MPNTFTVIQLVTQALLANLVNNLVFAAGADRRFEDDFGKQGHKIGDHLDIRRTPRHAIHKGAAYIGQNYVEETVRLTIDQQAHADVDFTSVENTLFMDDWNNRVGKPQAARLANEVDYDGLALYWQAYNSVLAADADLPYRAYLDAAALLDMEAVPRDDQRAVVVHPTQHPPLLDQLKGLFQQSTEIGRQYTDGQMGRTAGAKWSMDQNVAVHITGSRAGTPAAAAGSSGSTINLKGFTPSETGVLKRGDVFQVAGVYAVNPQSLQSTGQLRMFSVQADVDAGGTGLAAVPVAPAMIVPPDPRATVTALPLDNGVLTFLGTAATAYAQNLMYHPMGVTLGNVKLFVPYGGEHAVASDTQVSLAIRVWKDSDIRTDQHLSRADILYGWKWTMPECTARIWSPMA